MTEQPYTEEQIAEAMAAPNGSQRTPWRVVIGLTAAVLAATIAVVILTVVVASRNGDAREAVEVSDCRSLFDNKVGDARDVKADAFNDVVFELGRQLLESGASHPPTAFNPGLILAKVAKRDKAAADYDTALAARDKWVVAGSPLPCPIKAAGG